MDICTLFKGFYNCINVNQSWKTTKQQFRPTLRKEPINALQRNAASRWQVYSRSRRKKLEISKAAKSSQTHPIFRILIGLWTQRPTQPESDRSTELQSLTNGWNATGTSYTTLRSAG
jgi:hypothetical protein